MKLAPVNSKHGAPMGRAEIMKDTGDIDLLICHLLPVGIDEQGYDAGGAYWGVGEPLWHLFNAEVDDYAEGELVEQWFRASDKDMAEAQAIIMCPMPVQINAYAGDLDMDEFMDGYWDAALWSSTYLVRSEDDGDSDEPAEEEAHMDRDFNSSDIADSAKAEMRKECEDFAAANREDLLAYLDAGRSMAHAGHDFWLTRNGHGCGFWDRGLGELGDRLSKASKVYGSSDLYVGNDGKVYVQ